MEYIRKAINLDEVREFVAKQSPETKIYIGTDSERLNIAGTWYAASIAQWLHGGEVTNVAARRR